MSPAPDRPSADPALFARLERIFAEAGIDPAVLTPAVERLLVDDALTAALLAVFDVTLLQCATRTRSVLDPVPIADVTARVADFPKNLPVLRELGLVTTGADQCTLTSTGKFAAQTVFEPHLKRSGQWRRR